MGFPLIFNGREILFVLLHSEKFWIEDTEKQWPLYAQKKKREEAGEGSVKTMLIDDAASDYEHRMSTLRFVW